MKQEYENTAKKPFKVFIDGKAGTTGLEIYERLGAREDIEILTLPEEKRKDEKARKKIMNMADAVFLCLPDDAAKIAAELVENPDTVVLDTSTAHRTDEKWAYGFPELSPGFFEKIRSSKRIAVPGCHASGFIALVYPLIESGILPKDALLTCHSITGYSGGGKKMIAAYEDDERPRDYDSPRQYAIAQHHKHLPEMKKITGLENEPVFCPIVSDFKRGMVVTVPVFASMLTCPENAAEKIKDVYREKYKGPVVKFCENIDESGFIAANAAAGTDVMRISVCGNDERILLVSKFDNLGKGASGAGVECLNIALGTDLLSGMNLS